MKAIILAAGYATRLYPLTLNQPKPLLQVAGKPMMEHILAKLDNLPVDEVFIVTNDKFHSHFEEWKSSYQTDKKIHIVNDKTTSEEDKLGVLGDIKVILDHHPIEDDLIIFGGDNLFEESLEDMHAYFNEKESSIVGFKDVHDIEIAKRMGIGALDHNQRIISFVEKPDVPPSTFAATFIYFFKKKDIELIHKCHDEHQGTGEVKAGELIAYMIDKTPVHGYTLKQKWFDIGNHEQLKEADEYLRNRQ